MKREKGLLNMGLGTVLVWALWGGFYSVCGAFIVAFELRCVSIVLEETSVVLCV